MTNFSICLRNLVDHSKVDEETMTRFETRVLKRIYGPILENGVYRKITNR